MPKKLLKDIQTACTLQGLFLWTGNEGASKKATIAWDYMCNPKIYGWWNFKELTVWNHAAITKHFWDLSQKQDRLWIKWLHSYQYQTS